jgi:glycosyltransferase involved in cell wall biosynthesis
MEGGRLINGNALLPRFGTPRLRIAQVAPLYECVPPKLYGGTERVVSYVTDELVRRGHEVTLFASGDSQTSARLEAGCPQALRLAERPELATFLHVPMLTDAYQAAERRFDVIHSHVDYWSFPFARLTNVPSVATLHGRLDLEELHQVYSRYPDAAVVSISDAQREPLPHMNWVATIHHGLPRELLRFSPAPGKYLAFLGRISPEKRPDLAIDVAQRAGIPLKIAAKVDVVDRGYFETVIKPRLSLPGVEYVGEISDSEKSKFLGNALALLFTIDWPEPFGLAMIEAMACGTPVIARPCGSVPEVMTPGLTGYIAGSVDEMVAAVGKIAQLPRDECRREFERRFTVETMVDKYERVYRHLIEKNERQPLHIATGRFATNRRTVPSTGKVLNLYRETPQREPNSI